MLTCRLSFHYMRWNLPLKFSKKEALLWQRFSALKITTRSSSCWTSFSQRLSHPNPPPPDLSQLKFSWSVLAIKHRLSMSVFWTLSMLLRILKVCMEMEKTLMLPNRLAHSKNLLTPKRKRLRVTQTRILTKTHSLIELIWSTFSKVQTHMNSWQSSIR